MSSNRRGAGFFRGGARVDLAAPTRSPQLVGRTQILLSRFHPGMGCATVLKVGVQFRERSERKNIPVPSPYSSIVRIEGGS